MDSAHFHTLRRNAPQPLIKINLPSLHSPHVAGTGHREKEKLKRRLENRPAVVLVQTDQKTAKLKFVGDRRSMLYLHFEQRAPECVGRVIRRTQRSDSKAKDCSHDRSEAVRGVSSAACLDLFEYVQNFGRDNLVHGPIPDGRREVFAVMRALKAQGPLRVPREFVFMDRAAIGLGAVFLHLAAELNFHRLFNEAIEHFSIREVAARQTTALAEVGLNPSAP